MRIKIFGKPKRREGLSSHPSLPLSNFQSVFPPYLHRFHAPVVPLMPSPAASPAASGPRLATSAPHASGSPSQSPNLTPPAPSMQPVSAPFASLQHPLWHIGRHQLYEVQAQPIPSSSTPQPRVLKEVDATYVSTYQLTKMDSHDGLFRPLFPKW